jgi:hypothetical protein
MKKDRNQLLIQLTGALLFASVASAQSQQDDQRNSTNHLSLSLRFGMGISAKFKGIGGGLQPGTPAANGRRTPDGDAYNYDDGYVLTDVSGNFGNQTWYWGYDNSSQVSGNQILFNRTTAPGLPSSKSADDEPYTGVELTYERQLGIKENWHNLRYGIEGAANYMPISLNLNNRFTGNLSRLTDAYGFTPGTTPPSAPYQGTFNGPGFVIDSIPTSTINAISGATILEQDRFEANLFGFRLGPYLEYPINDRLSLRASGGLALGLLDASASWRQSISIPGEGTTLLSGQSERLTVLWGGYVSVNAAWQLSEHWNVEGGVQFQDLGKYSQKLGLRKVELDLSHSVFILVGIGYTF